MQNGASSVGNSLWPYSKEEIVSRRQGIQALALSTMPSGGFIKRHEIVDSWYGFKMFAIICEMLLSMWCLSGGVRLWNACLQVCLPIALGEP